MYAHRNFHQNALSVPWLTIKTSLSSFASVKMMLMALFSLYTSWCWKKLRLILSFIIYNHHVLKRGKSKKQAGGSKCPFPFHRFPVVWERCHINQSLDSFDLRDQQSLSPTWSGIRWQFVKRCGLCTAEGFAILTVLTISEAFDQPAICVVSLLFFQEKVVLRIILLI